MTNPYQTPAIESALKKKGRYRWSILLVIPTGMVVSGVFGALTNMINGAVSPEYFSIAMDWDIHSNIWSRSVVQGGLEGLLFGLLFALVFTITVAIATRLKCGYQQTVRYVFLAIGGTTAAWTIGGMIGFTWAAASPTVFRSVFPELPSSGAASFGWVGGSIWGAEFGGILVVVLTSALFVIRWKRRPGIDVDDAWR